MTSCQSAGTWSDEVNIISFIFQVSSVSAACMWWTTMVLLSATESSQPPSETRPPQIVPLMHRRWIFTHETLYVLSLFHCFQLCFPVSFGRWRGPRSLPRRVRNRRGLLQGGAQAERTGITFHLPNRSELKTGKHELALIRSTKIEPLW